MKKTIAQQLNITDFPFEIRDKTGNLIYIEKQDGFWLRWEYNSEGFVEDNRPKEESNKMKIEINGKQYKLVEI